MKNKSKGILFIITAAFFFSLMAMFIKLSGELPVMEKAFFRNLVAAFIAIATILKSRSGFKIKKGSTPILLLRSMCGLCGMVANFWAIDHLGIADANMLNKMAPFFAILMSFFIIGEKPAKFELISVFIAFIGACFIIKPGMNISSFPALVGLFGGLMAGAAYTFVRKLGLRGEHPSIIVAFFSVFSCLFCTVPMALNFVRPDKMQFLYLLLAGSSAAVAQFAVTNAYKYAPAKEISIFDYSQVLFAAIWGLIIFSEFPDHISIIGYIIIILTAVIKWRLSIKKN